MSQESLFTEMARPHCPYCGSPIHLVIDPSDEEDEYTEDCEVCCQPMVVTTLGDQLLAIRREDE